MTTVDVPSGAEPESDGLVVKDDPIIEDLVERPARRRRRRPAPRAHFFWRYMFPLLVVAAGVAVYELWREGTKAVLDSTDGRVVEVALDPNEPGYEAFVDATPTLLVLHTSGGDLAGVTFLALSDLELGGGAVLLSSDLLVEFTDDASEDQGEFLVHAYAESGAARVEFLLEQLFGYGFDEVVELSTKNLADSMRLVEPLPYLLPDDLVTEAPSGESVVWLEAGRWDLDADVAADVYSFRNPDEADANRLERQRAIWESWLESIGRSDNPDEAVLPFDEGIFPFLRSLGFGTGFVETPPLQPLIINNDGPPFYVLDAEGADWLEDHARELVPLPITAKSFVRPTVRLLDGIGDPGLRDGALVEIVDAGGVISVIGNASDFGVEETVVAYHREELAVAAAEIAAAIGAVATFDDAPDQPVDISVTIGLDLVAS